MLKHTMTIKKLLKERKKPNPLARHILDLAHRTPPGSFLAQMPLETWFNFSPYLFLPTQEYFPGFWPGLDYGLR